MWDTGPQSIESSKPQNPGCFLLHTSFHSLESSALVHIHNASRNRANVTVRPRPFFSK